VNKLIFFLFIFILIILLFQFECLLNKKPTRFNQKYTLEKLIEKPISNNYNDTSLYLLHSRSKYTENYYTLIDHNNIFVPDIPSPLLITIDNEGNFYIFNAYENLKVFDKKGNFIYKFDFPEADGMFSPLDYQNNIYIFYTKKTNNIVDSIVYRVNAINKTSTKLNRNEIIQLDKNLLIPKNSEEIIEKRKRENGKNGIYYEIIPSPTKIKSIYKNINGRFVSPESLIVYKLDETFDYKNAIPSDEFIYEKVDIKSLCNDKVIIINSFISDVDGNILISGIKSDETQNTKVKMGKEEYDAVKVYNLNFFVWKLRRK
jgi:hypothetical protein